MLCLDDELDADSSHLFKLRNTVKPIEHLEDKLKHLSEGRKEGNVLFNDTFNTFLYTVISLWIYG